MKLTTNIITYVRNSSTSLQLNNTYECALAKMSSSIISTFVAPIGRPAIEKIGKTSS